MQGPLNEGSGVCYLHYDKEYQILNVSGRGDNVIDTYYVNKSSPTILNPVSQMNFLNTTQKAFCVAPKWCVDTST